MRINEYRVMFEAVQDGIEQGLKEAKEIKGDVTEEQMIDVLSDEIMGSICSVFILDDDDDF